MTVHNYQILKKIYRHKVQFDESWQSKSGFQPFDVEIRVNWECNARCIMCGLHDYIEKHPEQRQYQMSQQEMIGLLDELKGLGCQYVTFSGGEPTLRDDLTDLVRYATQELGIHVALNTNGYLLDDAGLKSLLTAGLSSITYSLDSPLPEIHDQIRGLPSSYDQIVANLKYIAKYNQQHDRKVYTYINTVLLKENLLTLDKFVELYEEAPFDHLNFTPASINTPWDEWTTEIESLRPTVADVQAFKEQVLPKLVKASWPFKVTDPFGDQVEEIKKNLHVRFSERPEACYIPWVHTVIQCNGDVIPCCYAPDSHVVGNVLENSFTEIWNGLEYEKFRTGCAQVQYPMCESCVQYELLNRRIHEKMRSE